jgi:4-amino-4-deoxy-L-arabinose transferase-like glycosyltransferase
MMNFKTWFWVLNFFTAFLRFLIIGKIGLTVDEAHYWVYTKFLDFSYFDHPPFIAYIIKISTLIFGNTEFAVRFPAVVIFFFSCWLFFICIRKLYDDKTAFIGVLLLNFLPVFSFLGSVISIPDSPLAFFWLLEFLIFIKIIQEGNKNLWYLLGIVNGLALLSKYNGIFLVFSIFAFLVLSVENRFWLKRKEPYFTAIIAGVVFSPVIIWNCLNHWVSFGFQLKHGFGNVFPQFSLTLFGRSIGAQAGYLSPFLFLFFCFVIIVCTYDAFVKKDKNALLIACFSLPTLILFNAVAAFNEILPHWTAMGWLICAIYGAHLTIKFWTSKKFRIYSYFSWAFCAFLIVLAVSHILYKVIPIEKFLPQKQREKIEHGISEAERADITNDVYGWKEMAAEIRRIINSYPPEKRPFLFTHKFYLASQLSFAVTELRVFCISDRIDAYDIWQKDLSILNGKDGLFICSNFFFSQPQERYGNVFKEYIFVEEFPIFRNKKKSKNFFFTLCKNFDSSKLPKEYIANF